MKYILKVGNSFRLLQVELWTDFGTYRWKMRYIQKKTEGQQEWDIIQSQAKSDTGK